MKITFLAVFFVLISSGLIFSQTLLDEDDDDNDEIIVVSAGKIEQKLEDSVEKIQIVGAEEIKENGAKNLAEAMKNLPGVNINGASAGNPVDSITMQGFDSDYVKILVNGISLSGNIGGSVAVNSIPVEDVDHIEIVQGASSALYGSDAMGGVINIITKKQSNLAGKKKIQASISEEMTLKKDNNFRNYTAGSVNFKASKLSAGVSGAFDYTPGKKDYEYYAFAANYVDYYKSAKKHLAYGRFFSDWNDDWGKAGIYFTYSDSFQESNFTSVGFDTGSTMTYLSKRIEGGLSGEYKINEKLLFSGFSSIKYFLLNTDYSSFTVNPYLKNIVRNSTVTDSNFIDWESEIHGSWNLNSCNEMLFGINGNLQTIDGDSFDRREKQLLLSLFAQDKISFFEGKLSVIPGFRFDFSPALESTDSNYEYESGKGWKKKRRNSPSVFMVTPKLSIRFDPIKNTVVRFSYGMGYKIPTLKQKYWIFYHNYAPGEGNFILNGNPDLESEKSQSFNLSLEQNIINILKLNVSGYFNFINDMIDSRITDNTTNPQTRTYENIGKAITYGGDISVGSKFDRFNFRAGYAYTGAKAYDEDCSSWDDLSLRVTHRVTLNLGYLIPVAEAKISGNFEWNSRQLLTTGGDDYSPDFLMVGANLSKTFFDEKIEAYFRVDNILNNLNFANGTDKKSQEEYYNLYDGTSVSIGTRIKF